MESIIIKGKTNDSIIKIGELDHLLPEMLPNKRCIYITDKNVFSHYTSFFSDKEHIIIPPGEQYKTLKTTEEIYTKLLDMEVDRQCFIVGFGGGLVTDVAGYVASTFMRGIPFGFISTSLLGQVDAVIGGKNGVNFEGYKNLVGTFTQPEFVINDPQFFQTLPSEEFLNGTAEVIKQFIIADKRSYHWLKNNTKAFLAQDTAFMNDLIFRQCSIKAKVVRADEREQGLRKILNFGHTVGHAIEREAGIAHGFAVSTGMLLAAKISERLAFIPGQITRDLEELLLHFGLPVSHNVPIKKIIDTIKKDKKRAGRKIDFIVLHDEGKAGIEPMTFEDIEKHLRNI